MERFLLKAIYNLLSMLNETHKVKFISENAINHKSKLKQIVSYRNPIDRVIKLR